MEHIVRDAAQSLGQAPATLCNAKEHRWRVRDIAISYTDSGAITVFADGTTGIQRARMEEALRAAFTAAGWGVGPWSYGPGLRILHPTTMTRLQHPVGRRRPSREPRHLAALFTQALNRTPTDRPASASCAAIPSQALMRRWCCPRFHGRA